MLIGILTSVSEPPLTMKKNNVFLTRYTPSVGFRDSGNLLQDYFEAVSEIRDLQPDKVG
jgi:hypothetical protein